MRIFFIFPFIFPFGGLSNKSPNTTTVICSRKHWFMVKHAVVKLCHHANGLLGCAVAG